MEDLQILINFFAFLVLFTVLFFASIEDIKYREISNKCWKFLIGVGLLKITTINIIIYLFSSSYNSQSLTITPIFMELIQLSIGIIIGFILYRVGLFGGGDFKAVIVISLFIPSISDIQITQGTLYSENIFIFPIISFYLNLGTLLLFFCAFIFLYNLIHLKFKLKLAFEGHEHESILKKFIVFLSSLSISPIKGEPGYYYLREIVKNNKLIFRFDFKSSETDLQLIKERYNKELRNVLDFYSKIGINRKEVWINPIIPLIPFITIDLFLLIFIGDIILIISHLF
ncbi:MAG: prepilin peptidase [Candidatus Helarchaeota archaeon]